MQSLRGSIYLLLVCAACGRAGFDPLGGAATSDGGDSDGALTDSTNSGDGALGDSGTGNATSASYTLMSMMTPPTARRSTSAALEPGTPDRLWVFGGYNGSYLSDLWVQNQTTGSWLSLVGTGTPPGPRERHVLVWEPDSNALVLFGGQHRPMIAFVHYDELFVLRPSNGMWAQIAKSGQWPAPRKDAVMFWVPHLSKFLLYGGNDGGNTNNRMNDVWLLTLDVAAATGSWAQVSTTGVVGPAASAGCAGYDPVGRRLILFGGETADGVDPPTTYQFFVDTATWQLDTVSGTTPAGQSFQQCTWDPVAKRLLVYGGQADGMDPLGGAYAYDPDGKTWTVLSALNTSPGNRADGGAVYSAATGELVWFGGRTGATTYANQTWRMKVQ